MQKDNTKQTKLAARIGRIVEFVCFLCDMTISLLQSGETFIKTNVSIVSRLAKLNSFLFGSQCDFLSLSRGEIFIHILL